MKRIIKSALILSGVILLVGSPGACDRGVISYGQAMIQSAIGCGLFGIAYIIGAKRKENEKCRDTLTRTLL